MGKLGLLFVLLPAAELFVLVRLARSIGGWPTFLLLLASAALGALIARSEGLRVLAQMRQAVGSGTMPSGSVLDGVLILCAAALLIVPGVITDLLAFALLLPWSRQLIAQRLLSSVESAVAQGKLRVVAQARAAETWPRVPQAGANAVIDTEGETVASSVVDAEPDEPKPPRLSS